MNVVRSVCFTALLCVAPALMAAQEPNAPVATRAPAEARIYVGMWTAHVRRLHHGFENNWLVALSWRGFYGGTFINSYGDRAFAAGIQRTVARGEDGAVVPTLGYRFGLVTGYDGRFLPIASKTPVMPMAQLLGGVDLGRTGMELAFGGLVASLTPRLRL